MTAEALRGPRRGGGFRDWLASEVLIPVYLVHRSDSVEDYEIFCDFTAFFDGGIDGPFRRPVLEIWGGRRDLDRTRFAARMREAFLHQYAEAVGFYREAHGAELRRREVALRNAGWGAAKMLGAAGLMALRLHPAVNAAMLALSVAAGRQAAQAVLEALGSGVKEVILGRGGHAGALERQAPRFRALVDRALQEAEIRLHPRLYAHAHPKGVRPGPMAGIVHDAWPLPDWVAAHLGA